MMMNMSNIKTAYCDMFELHTCRLDTEMDSGVCAGYNKWKCLAMELVPYSMTGY